jgi:hypothetical protein
VVGQETESVEEQKEPAAEHSPRSIPASALRSKAIANLTTKMNASAQAASRLTTSTTLHGSLPVPSGASDCSAGKSTASASSSSGCRGELRTAECAAAPARARPVPMRAAERPGTPVTAADSRECRRPRHGPPAR